MTPGESPATSYSRGEIWPMVSGIPACMSPKVNWGDEDVDDILVGADVLEARGWTKTASS